MVARRRLEQERGPSGLLVRSVLAPEPWSPWAVGGVAAVAAVAAVDVATDSGVALATALAVVTLVVGVAGRRGDALSVAAAALVAAIASGAWDGWGLDDTVALVVVAAAAIVSGVIALGRARAIATQRQLELLRRLLALARDDTGVETLVDRLLDLVVPAMADLASLELLRDGHDRRLAARATGPDREALEAALTGRRPTVPHELAGSRLATAGARPRMMGPFDEPLLRELAADDDDLERLRGLRIRWALDLPLETRGAAFGALSLAVVAGGRRYTREDLEFGELVAGRVAIVLDNAGLTRTAQQIERRMRSALDTLKEAVTMNGPDGRTIYVNEAAVRLLKATSADELLSAEVGAISDRFAIYDEDGRPVEYRDLPAFKVLAGDAEPEAMLVRNVVRETGEERWLVNKVTVLRDESGRPDRVVNVIEDVTEVKQAELRQRLLSEASRALSSSLDYGRTLRRIAEVAVPGLADWCSVDVPARGGRIEPVAIAHTDPVRRAIGEELRRRYPERLDDDTDLARVIREGTSALIARIPDAAVVAYARDPRHLALLRGVGFGSILIVPLVAGGEPLGALTLVRSDPVRQFSDADRAIAEELGQRAGVAVLNARLYGERSRIARELEAGIKPPELPPMPGLDVATLYRPAGELNDVGGDFYDAFPTPRGWMLVMGDVAGQGARAAALTSLARFTLRSVGQLTGDPVIAVGQVNRTLREQREMSLCTIAVLLLDGRKDGGLALTTVVCGHPLPVLVRDGRPMELGAPGPLTGAFDDAEWPATTTRLADGDMLVLYTDGVLDTVGRDGRFGDERLLELLAVRLDDPRAVIDRVDAAVRAFQIGPQHDDTAIVVLTVRSAAAAAGAAPSDPSPIGRALGG